MKRDMDFIRDLLLKIEDGSLEDSTRFASERLTDANAHRLDEHIKILVEAGYVDGVEEDVIGASGWYFLRLTWQGHEYLGNIRDPEIWRKTKEGLIKVGGFSFDIVGALAKGLIKKQIEKHTGIELNL